MQIKIWLAKCFGFFKTKVDENSVNMLIRNEALKDKEIVWNI